MLITETTHIQQTPDVVFDYLIQIPNRAKIIPLLEEVILLDPLPIQVGSRYIEVSTIAGQSLKTTYMVAEIIPNERIKVKTVKSIFPIAVMLLLKPVESSDTQVEISLDFTLKGLYKLAAPMVQGIVKQQAREILSNLKTLLEEG